MAAPHLRGHPEAADQWDTGGLITEAMIPAMFNDPDKGLWNSSPIPSDIAVTPWRIMSSHPHPHGGFAPPERATEVSEGISPTSQPDGSWWINNTGFLVGRTGVVSVDAATTLGPCLVTPEELEPFRSGKGFDLAMTASVNGCTYSTGNWNDLYWSFPQMLAYASRGTELRPGDVIGSGTVGTGCILELSRVHGHDAYPWLTAGVEVHLEIAGLGSITTCIAPATREPIPLV